MLETPVLRNEHSRSLADAETFKALDTLTELGMLIPFEQVGYAGGTANAAAAASGGVETAQYVSTDSDARILDASFDSGQLAGQDAQRYHDALQNLAIGVTEGSPVSYQFRNQVESIMSQLQGKQKQFITSEDVQEIAQPIEDEAGVVDQLAGSYNARQLALTDPNILARELLSADAEIANTTLQIDGQDVDVPINLEYAARYLQQAHIVGVKRTATGGGDTVSLFESNKVQTVEATQKAREQTWKRLGALTNLSEVSVGALPENANPLMQTLKDAHAKPEQLIADARRVPGYAEIFDADSGSGGFTLGEHTETVLRNFAENFADQIPVELIAPMNLGIIVHDIGKSIASANKERAKQKEYNLAQAADFFGKIGVDKRTQGLIFAMIGEGQEHAFEIDVKKRASANAEMRDFAERTILDFNGSAQADPAQVEAFETMCRILHTVDGGAYTSIAVTRRDGEAGNYRNFPLFNGTFAQPTDRSRRSLNVRRPDQTGAKADMTPRRADYKAPTVDLDVLD